MKKKGKRKEKLFTFSWHDMSVTGIILIISTGIAFILRIIDKNQMYMPLLFVMAVFLVSRFTNGYLYGTVSSFICVIIVNFLFTYPYFAFDFSISGYPLTFLIMLATSVMTSTMTTQIKQHERIRAEAEREKLRGNLLRSVSHDLRTPLTAIVGSVSALLDNEDRLSKVQQRKLLRESKDDAEWLIRMVENLLSVTRINGETKIQKLYEAVEEIVGESVQKLKKRFPAADISVSVPCELLLVPMDAVLIEQVIINILENAIIHGKCNSGITLKVSADSKEAVFNIYDTGEGIPIQVLDHIFDGYLSKNSDSDNYSQRNMGIGLGVCRSIIAAHGGNISAENRECGGAHFRFTLPLKEESYVK